jgi:hypothetical protein
MTDRPDRSEVCRLLNLVSQANAVGPFVVRGYIAMEPGKDLDGS